MPSEGGGMETIMKKPISLLLCVLTASSLLASCSGGCPSDNGQPVSAQTSSAETEEAAEWLNARLGGDYSGAVTLSLGTQGGIDFSAFPDGGYVIRTQDGDTAICASSADMLDRAVRRFANDLAGTGDVYETYGEGYKVKSLSIDGTDISEWSVTVETLGEEGFEENPTFAAQELQTYIEKECGVTLHVEIKSGASGASGADKAGRVIRIVQAPKDDPLGKDGLHIYFKNGDLILRGGYKRGTMYAVYEFLENYAGWRFFGLGDMTYVVPADALDIPGDIDHEAIPVIPMRYQRTWLSGYPQNAPANTFNIGYTSVAAPRRNNAGGANVSAAKHGYLEANRGSCHTFEAQLTGLYSGPQPCYTDEFLIEALGESLKQSAMAYTNAYKDDQGMPLISVGPNDNPYFCTCKNCTKALKEGGGALSSVFLGFINPAIEYANEEYPDMFYFTIAYQNTVKPPKNIRPVENLYITYCTNAMCMKHSLLDYEDCTYGGTTCAEAREHILGWAELTDHLGIWMYYSNFCNILCPVATFETMRENVRFFADIGVELLTYETYNYGFGFDDLRNYMMSLIFWDPYMTDEEYYAHMEEYMAAYYGDGWESIYEYLCIWEQSAQNSHRCFATLGDNISQNENYTHPWYNSMDYVAKYDEILSLFDDARALATSAEAEARIDFLKVHVYYFHLCSAYDEKYVNGTEEERAEYEELYLYYCGLLTYYGKTPDKVSAYLMSSVSDLVPDFTVADLKYNPSCCIW